MTSAARLRDTITSAIEDALAAGLPHQRIKEIIQELVTLPWLTEE